MRSILVSLALTICALISGACSQSASTSGGVTDAAKPLPNEMYIKQRMLEAHSPPDAAVLTTVKQMRGTEGLMEYPVSLASSDDGNIYISDNNGQALYHAPPDLVTLKKLLTSGENGQLQYPNTVQIWRNEILVSDNDGIKVFGRNGSFRKLLRTFYATFHFTVDTHRNIYANPTFLMPKESDPLIVKLDEKGMRVAGFGKRLNRKEHNYLEDEAYLCELNGNLVAAFKHQPLVQIYSSEEGKLLREFNVSHPVFGDLKRLEEDKEFVNPKEGVIMLPRYMGGVKAISDKIYVLLYLPRPEIVEFDFQGKETGRYRAQEELSAANYFGFDVRLAGDSRQFVVGVIDPLHMPALITLRPNVKAQAPSKKERAK